MARLSTLLAALEPRSTNLDLDKIEVTKGSLKTNSLEITPGDVFLCISGDRFDGHDFICVAADRGAVCVIVSRVTEFLYTHPEIGYVELADTRLAGAVLFNELCGRPTERMCFVGVTGTNGKTSTVWFLRHIFEKAGYVTGLIGTIERIPGSGDRSDMTTPPPELLYPELERMADSGVEIVFIEASSHALEQKRLEVIKFELAIFTNLTRDHLDYHKDMEHYFAAKRRLLELSRAALVNADDEYMSGLLGSAGIPTVCYSVERQADFTATLCKNGGSIKTGSVLCEYELCGGDSRFTISCPIPGGFTVSNTLAAASAARLFGISPEVIADALASCPQIPGRLEALPIPERLGFRVYIDYAHTPDALEKAVAALSVPRGDGGRLILLFGCGGDRDRTKRPIMGSRAAELAELVIVTSDNSRSENPRRIILDILRGIPDRSNVRAVIDRAEAIRTAIALAKPGDVVLLAGKGHEDYIIDSRGKRAFDERRIVADCIRELYSE